MFNWRHWAPGESPDPPDPDADAGAHADAQDPAGTGSTWNATTPPTPQDARGSAESEPQTPPAGSTWNAEPGDRWAGLEAAWSVPEPARSSTPEPEAAVESPPVPDVSAPAPPGPETAPPPGLETAPAPEAGPPPEVAPPPETAPPPPVALDEAREAIVVGIANQKGGVGKTTTAVSLAASLALQGAQVLLVDLDPQGNATTGLGLRGQEGAPSTYRVLIEGLAIEDATEPTSVRGLHCVPSSLDLAGAEIELVSIMSRELRLRKAIDEVRDLYDVILLDCPPSLGLLTINALTAADQVLVPIQCEYYALEGLGQLMRTIDLVRGNLNADLELGGVVLTMYDARTRLSQQVADEVRGHFGDRVYEAIVPRTVRLSEAPGFGQPITVFDPSSRGSRAYERLADEMARRLGITLRGGQAFSSDATEGGTALDRLLAGLDEPAAEPNRDKLAEAAATARDNLQRPFGPADLDPEPVAAPDEDDPDHD